MMFKLHQALGLTRTITRLPHRRAWQLAWPMMVANISTPLMGLADTAMLGHLDNPVFLAAVAIGSSIISLLYWMFAFLRMGTTSVTAQAIGAKRTSEVSQHLVQNIFLGLGIGAAMIASQYLLIHLALTLIATDETLRSVALAYCSIRIYSAPAVLATYAAMGWMIGLGKPKIALIITVTTNVLNILLDYLFIVHMQWAAEGAAYATIIAEYTAFFAALLFCIQTLKMRGWPWKFEINLEYLKHNFRLNADLFIRTLAILFAINFFNAQSARMGSDVLAANAILLQCTLFISFFLDSYALAAETMTAQAIGAGKERRFHRAAAVTTLSALGISLVLCLLFALEGSRIITTLTDLSAVVNIANDHLGWLLVMPIVSVWCYALDGIFIGAGKANLMRNTMLFSVFCVFIPAWWLLQGMGNHGLWFAFVLFNLSRGITLGGAYWTISKQRAWCLTHKKSGG